MKNTGVDDLTASLAAEIKTIRLAAKISQEALALAADVDRTYISQLERGVANPSLKILVRIASVLGKELQISFLEEPTRASRRGK